MLFSGPSGTGKTMASGIVAKELGLELYRADISRLISKYIGETEKNLSLVFDEAKKCNMVLLFDETDALFSKRTAVKDSHDRGANIEISYLLQKIEEFDGVCVMTTNFLENIDKAFFRRITYIINFSLPNRSERKKIWHSMFKGPIPIEKNIDFDFLSKFEISGGTIKNTAISAAFFAAQQNKKIETKDLIKSLIYEFKKLGHTIIKSDFNEYSYLT
ncbi:MAG: ATP-binding protein [Oscillospiraceae bacterium]|nr:ATP-binding protein [Oscillospiraceae bacterium]